MAMHELALAERVVKSVLDFKAEKSIPAVAAVNIKIGVLQQVSSESLLFSLEALSKGTELEGARFNLERVKVAVRCDSCGAESVLEKYLLRCPSCGRSDVRVTAGKSVFIDSIEVPDRTEDRRQRSENG